jgi:hypothetical protein
MFGSARACRPSYEHSDYSTRRGVDNMSPKSTSDTQGVLELRGLSSILGGADW